MELAIDVLVRLLQIALGAFLLWGASLCLPPKTLSLSQFSGFERVASLVLLALLYTTLAGLA